MRDDVDVSASDQTGGAVAKGLFGFRSRTPWKMVVAGLYYLLAVVSGIAVMTSRKPYASNGTDIALEVLSGALLTIAMMSPALLLSDFGYRHRLPLFRRRKVVLSALGLVLFFGVMVATSAIADTLHTAPYKEAAAKETAQQEAVANAKREAAAKRKSEADATRAAEEDAKRAAEANSAAEAKRAADAKRAAEASAAAEAKRVADQKKATQATSQPKGEPSGAAGTSYPFQKSSTFAEGTPERVVADYAAAWKAKDWNGMVTLVDYASQSRESDLAGQLKSWYDFKPLRGFRIDKVERSDYFVDVTYTIWYEYIGVEEKVVTAKVLKMTPDGKLDVHGEWGVNPTSALRESDK